jgi:hypothetical protein
MLETIAIAALLVGGVSTAAVITDEEAVSKQDRQPVATEVQTAPAPEADAAKSPFLN